MEPQQWSSSVSFNNGPVTAVAKVGRAVIGGLYIANYATSARWIQLHNKATALTAGDVPVMQFAVQQGGGATIPTVLPLGQDFFGIMGSVYSIFTNGLTWGVSTTNGTYTAASAGDCDVQVQYA